MKPRRDLFFRGRKLGHIDYSDRTYKSERLFERHFYFKFDGYGISQNVLDVLEKENIEKVKLFITDRNEVLETTTGMFLVKGIEVKDDTFGKEEVQLILPMKFWNKKIASIHQAELGMYGN